MASYVEQHDWSRTIITSTGGMAFFVEKEGASAGVGVEFQNPWFADEFRCWLFNREDYIASLEEGELKRRLFLNEYGRLVDAVRDSLVRGEPNITVGRWFDFSDAFVRSVVSEEAK